LKCRGSENAILESGLIRFVQLLPDVPHRLLIAWAADCVEHQIDAVAPPPRQPVRRYRLPNETPHEPELSSLILPAVRQWLSDGTIGSILYQRTATTGSPRRDVGVAGSLALAVVRSEMEGEERTVRYRIAEIVSTCYHAAGGTRDERTWQEECLIRYLLGYRE
jgi:hypothetical protein